MQTAIASKLLVPINAIKEDRSSESSVFVEKEQGQKSCFLNKVQLLEYQVFNLQDIALIRSGDFT